MINNVLREIYVELGGSEQLTPTTSNYEILNKIATLKGGEPKENNFQNLIEILKQL